MQEQKQGQIQTYRTRFDKAQVIAHSRQIMTIAKDPKHWLIESETFDGKFYKVGLDGCECPDNQIRGETCKHILALSIWFDGGNV